MAVEIIPRVFVVFDHYEIHPTVQQHPSYLPLLCHSDSTTDQPLYKTMHEILKIGKGVVLYSLHKEPHTGQTAMAHLYMYLYFYHGISINHARIIAFEAVLANHRRESGRASLVY
jgi:hypothetical protein